MVDLNSIKLFFCDVETTGIDPKVNGITQIAAEIGTLGLDGIYKRSDTLDFPVAPFPNDVIEPTALEVQKRTREEIALHPAPLMVYRKLLDVLSDRVDRFNPKDKLFFVGYNSPFDNSFMREFWAKCGDKYFGSFFFNPDICVMRMAVDFLRFKRVSMTNFKLVTVAREMGIEYDETTLHNAVTDIAITRQMYFTMARHGDANR